MKVELPVSEEAPESLFSLSACQVRAGEKAAISKPRGESSPEPDHTGSLIVAFQPPECEKN